MTPVESYVDLSFLAFLAKKFPPSGDPGEEWKAARNIWKYYEDKKLRLLTDESETEVDMIVHLNSHGCFVSDTLMTREEIGKYKGWKKADPSLVEEFVRMVDYYEDLEYIKPLHDRQLSGVRGEQQGDTYSFIDRLLANVIKEQPGREKEGLQHASLKECLCRLGEKYTENLWRDLKRIDYELNWEILEQVLTGYGASVNIRNEEGSWTRNLFGLFLRAVALSKKSSRSPEMTDSHMEFVIATVLNKYSSDARERCVRHMAISATRRIQNFLTMEPCLIGLIKDESEGADFCKELQKIGVRCVSPTMLERIILQ